MLSPHAFAARLADAAPDAGPALVLSSLLILVGILGALALIDAIRFELRRRRMDRVGRRGIKS